jgi:Ser/Thr protein kinase RdoA (MazF antagonist)
LRDFLVNSPLDREAKQIIEKAAARMRTLVSRVPNQRQSFGLIHADFHGDNLIFDGERIWIVDLDDIGWGHFLFDVAWPSVLFAKHHPGAGEFLEPLLRGYERVGPLNSTEKLQLPEFQIAAGIGALEMVATSHLASDAPVAIEWFDFAVGWLREHLDRASKKTGELR